MASKVDMRNKKSVSGLMHGDGWPGMEVNVGEKGEVDDEAPCKIE